MVPKRDASIESDRSDAIDAGDPRDDDRRAFAD